MTVILALVAVLLLMRLIILKLDLKDWKERAKLAEARDIYNETAEETRLKSQLYLSNELVAEYRKRIDIALYLITNNRVYEALKALRGE